MKDLFIATGNSHKTEECRLIAAENSAPFRILSLEDLSADQRSAYQPEENGASFQENAFIKARDLFRITGKPVFADDSGLVVDLLDGEPGLHSARYAETDKLAIDKVLSELRGRGAVPITMDGREVLSPARFVACICYLDNEESPVYFIGRAEGFIQTHSDPGGFGYDPIFYFPPVKKSFGAMGEEKMRLSHRYHALKQMFQYLQRFG